MSDQQHRIVGIALTSLIFLGTLLTLYKNRANSVSVDAPPESSEEFEILGESTSSKIVIEVAGAVREPGVYDFDSDARLFDVLARAGGPSDEADLEFIEKNFNLAAKVADGTKVYVPRMGEDSAELSGDAQTGGASYLQTTSGIAVAASGDNTPGGVQGGAVINLNSASASEIAGAGLYRIGPKTAEKIVAYRTANGAFRALEDLLNVEGIGEKTIEGMRGKVSF